jgi:hypothetical protein
VHASAHHFFKISKLLGVSFVHFLTSTDGSAIITTKVDHEESERERGNEYNSRLAPGTKIKTTADNMKKQNEVVMKKTTTATKKKKKKHILVGGPLLGTPHHAAASSAIVDKHQKHQRPQQQNGNNNSSSSKSFAPLITPEVFLGKDHPGGGGAGGGERFILLPQARFITVLAYKTGERLGALVLSSNSGEDANSDVGIESVVLAMHGRTRSSSSSLLDALKQGSSSSYKNNHHSDHDRQQLQVVLVACSNGTIHEYALSDLLLQYRSSLSLSFVDSFYGHVGPHQVVPGPCFLPRRIFQLIPSPAIEEHDENVTVTYSKIQHLSIPNKQPQQQKQQQQQQQQPNGLVAYALVETTTITKKQDDHSEIAESVSSSSTTTTLQLVRLCLPSPNADGNNSSSSSSSSSSKGSSTSKKNNDKQVVTMDVAAQIMNDSVNVKHNDKNNGNNNIPLALLSTAVHHQHGGGLVSKQKNKLSNSSVLVVIAQPHSLTVYLESSVNNDLKYSTCAVFDAWPSRSNPLCTLVLSPDGRDVSLGMLEGEIFVLDHFLPRYADYLVTLQAYEAKTASLAAKNKMTEPAPQHPGKDIIWRKLHWHSHGVATLSYETLFENDADDAYSNDAINNSNNNEPRMLYSGGIESCLVTWQLGSSGASSRPSEILPRVAMGGILHIATSCMSSGEGRILVYCSDNTLTLYEAHNSAILWRVQGLATTTNTAGGTRTDGQHVEGKGQLKMSPDFYGNNSNSKTSRHVVVSGLPQAPGCIQWFDPLRQRVVKSLEVVSYNRVSRTEMDDVPVPVSSVIRTAWSDSGKDLMTIHVTPTTNQCMGALQKLHGGKLKFGLVTVLRFWSAAATSRTTTSEINPYEASAAMTYPHGRQNQVSAIALSHNGSFACTLSNDDGAFRLWRKTQTKDDNGAGGESSSPSASSSSYAWTCQYKVGIPAGYSNFKTGNHAVAFSSDDSILAIAFGNMITLWNHAEANLICSLRHLDDNNQASVVESLQFLPGSGKFVDSLLSRSSRGVTLQSPYGAQGPTNHGWCWEIPSSEKNMTVAAAEYLSSDNEETVAVALHERTKDCSHIIWINVETGQAKADETHCQIQGKVISITAELPSKTSRRKSNWIHESSSSPSSTLLAPVKSSVRMHALTDHGEVVALNTHDDMDVYAAARAATATATAAAPIIDLLAVNRNVHNHQHHKKRTRADIIVHPLEAAAASAASGPRKKLALDKFGSTVDSGSGGATQDLPLLYGAFTRAFVGRNLQKRNV